MTNLVGSPEGRWVLSKRRAHCLDCREMVEESYVYWVGIVATHALCVPCAEAIAADVAEGEES